ncbi:MAG: class I SAM-dependent methyltransferase [Candidatus Krumholzibacteria bacterium]|nr:class I SAM-dependent methyltransferase [Candidatus Krumholzibacteria bacterium]
MERVSERRHWDEYWNAAEGTGGIYDNEGRIVRHLAALMRLDGLRVLEVGAGTGRDGILMAARGARVVSLDYSRPSLDMIRGGAPEGADLEPVCGDAFALPFPDCTFDLVFHQGLLEHFRNPLDMLAEHRRVLRPGGHILVDVPQRWHYYTVIKHILIAAGKWFAGWETEFSPRRLERLLEEASFTVVQTYGEWLNPPIWYRMLRRGIAPLGVRLPMDPRLFRALRRSMRGVRGRLLRMRPCIYTAVVIGTIARRDR